MTSYLETKVEEFTPHDEERIVRALRIYYSNFDRRRSTTLKGAIVRSLCFYDKFIDNYEVGRLYDRTVDFIEQYKLGMPGNREEAKILLDRLNEYLASRRKT